MSISGHAWIDMAGRKKAACEPVAAELGRRFGPATSGPGDVAAVRTFHPPRVGRDYFVEVRHARPTGGTGDFTIAVRPPSGGPPPGVTGGGVGGPSRRVISWEEAGS